MVTYEQLKSGYILQQNDELVLHGVNYRVDTQPDGYYLWCPHRVNSYVFDVLGMGLKEREVFVEEFSPTRFGDAQGSFPEFSDLKALTDLVIALYEVPEYKEGDWVTILPKESDGYTPVIYTYEMEGCAGNTYQVKCCNLRREIPTHNGVNSGDPHSYNLFGVGYYWTTQMIRKATEEEIRDAKGEAKDSDYLKSSELMASGYLKPLSEEPTDTEIRLPNNEEDTPHIKL